MWYVRGLVCAFVVMLSTAAFAEGEEGAVDATPNKVEELLTSKLAERIKAYLNQGLLESEQLSQYVDREYWNAIKDDFGVRVGTIISEDAFIQVILPILESVKAELQELVKLTLQELVVRGDSIATRVRVAMEQLRQKSAQVIEQGITKIKALAESKPEEYKAMIVKLGQSAGQTAINAVQETTLLAAVVLLALSMEIISHSQSTYNHP